MSRNLPKKGEKAMNALSNHAAARRIQFPAALAAAALLGSSIFAATPAWPSGRLRTNTSASWPGISTASRSPPRSSFGNWPSIPSSSTTSGC